MIILSRPDEFANARMQVFAHCRSVVDHRIDQMLEGEFRSRPVAGIERCGGCKTAASTLSFDTDAGGIKPKLWGICM
jgi:hypothetical protein